MGPAKTDVPFALRAHPPALEMLARHRARGIDLHGIEWELILASTKEDQFLVFEHPGDGKHVLYTKE